MKNRIIYSIDVEDLQTVAEEELDRELTDEEIKIIENKICDYIDWYGAVCNVMDDLQITE